MVSPVFEQETYLAGVTKSCRQVQGGVPPAVLGSHSHAIQDQELCGHHTSGQDALVDRGSLTLLLSSHPSELLLAEEVALASLLLPSILTF